MNEMQPMSPFLRPKQRSDAVIKSISGPARRLARWPWLTVYKKLKAQEPVNPFQARWARLSMLKLGGRLTLHQRTPPTDEIERIKWESEREDRGYRIEEAIND